VSTPSSFAIDVPRSLIERLKASDERAFEQLYRLFERPVTRALQAWLARPACGAPLRAEAPAGS